MEEWKEQSKHCANLNVSLQRKLCLTTLAECSQQTKSIRDVEKVRRGIVTSSTCNSRQQRRQAHGEVKMLGVTTMLHGEKSSLEMQA